MPAPLATPARYTGPPGISERRTQDLGKVSVVMMARATAEAFSTESCSTRVGSGVGEQIEIQRHPDDAGGGHQHLRRLQAQELRPLRRALSGHLEARRPVQALALPEFTSTARQCPWLSARFCRDN